jgi:hypothetical protein
MARLLRIFLILLFFPAADFRGRRLAWGARLLTSSKARVIPDMVRDADVTFTQIGAKSEDFDVRAQDGAVREYVP